MNYSYSAKALFLFFILHVSFFITPTAFGQDEYRAAAIPAALRERADAVIRRYETSFVVKSPGEAVETTHIVVTILKADGDEQARQVAWYDKFNKVTDIEGTLYDADGTVIKKLKRADVDDFSTYLDGDFQDDSRYKLARFPKQPNYPYTVEFRVETRSRNLMFYPRWQPQYEDKTALEQASLVVDMPAGLVPRYQQFNLPEPVRQPGTEGRTTYRWQANNLTAHDPEPNAPPGYELRPAVFLAPTEFDVQAYKGNFRTWNDMGLFYNSLNANRDILPEAVRQQVIGLTTGEKTLAGKVQKVYEFMQSQTRYVSIQLGIGGWQTIDALTVADRKYGDCKALTNYTKALLKAIGILACEVLLRAGNKTPDILTGFPSSQFNHVALCVPDGRDSLWLECTSQTEPMGYVGDFTGSRHGLLLTPTGGRLIQTPTYWPTDNRQARHVALSLSQTGDATATATSEYTGLQHDDRARLIHGSTQPEQKTWLLKNVQIPNFDLNTFTLTEQKKRIPAVRETLNLTIRKWATLSGTRLFVPLNVLSVSPAVAAPARPRVAPLVLGADYNFVATDTVIVTMPTGYKPEFLPPPILIEAKFGRYTAQTRLDTDKLIYLRQWQMHRGRYAPTDYTAWVDFRRQINKADRMQIVLVKP